MNHSEWHGSSWYLLLFPAFVFGAGNQLMVGIWPTVIAFCLAIVLFNLANRFLDGEIKDADWKQRTLIFVVIPSAIFLICYISGLGYVFRNSDFINPYLSPNAQVGRAVVSGVVSSVITLVGVGAQRLFHR